MTTAVVDANALVSGFVRANPRAAPTLIIDLWEASAFELITSAHIIAEVERTFEDPYFRRRMGVDQRSRALMLLRRRARVVEITVEVLPIATHPEDDQVLATVASGRADYLVTGDLQLQRIGSHEGAQILSPRLFLDVLQREGGGETSL